MEQTFSVNGESKIELGGVVADRRMRMGMYAVYAVDCGESQMTLNVEARVGGLEDDLPLLKTVMTYAEFEAMFPNHEVFVNNARFQVGKEEELVDVAG